MIAFAELLERLTLTPGRLAKVALLRRFFETEPDPDRGWGLAALTGELAFDLAKPGIIRAVAERRLDPVLFAWSYDFVGDLAETVSLMWEVRDEAEHGGDPPGLAGTVEAPGLAGAVEAPGVAGAVEPPGLAGTVEAPGLAGRGEAPGLAGKVEGPPLAGAVEPPGLAGLTEAPSLADVVEALSTTPKSALPALVEHWMDRSDPPVRYAILKLITGALRVGASARLAKTALAELSAAALVPDDIEEVWHGLAPPYGPLFAWIEGRGERPDPRDAPVFRPPMLAHPIEAGDLAALDPATVRAEWKWDGIRVQLVSTPGGARLYSRGADEIGGTFPEIVDAVRPFDVVLDGELLVIRDGVVAPFADLQQRLGRKEPSARMMATHPVGVRLYDILFADGDDLRPLPFDARRARLEAWIAEHRPIRMDLSGEIPFGTIAELAAIRHGTRAASIEGLMLKRRDSPYVPGRPKGLWWKWKRDPLTVDAVMMYAQRGSGRRSSFYSDYTFGLWRDGADGTRELVPIGKAYSGYTDDELVGIDRWIRNHTVSRFGPVREVEPGFVLEVAFDAAQRSARHKSGVALRFPRIARLRPDKPAAEADELATLLRLIPP